MQIDFPSRAATALEVQHEPANYSSEMPIDALVKRIIQLACQVVFSPTEHGHLAAMYMSMRSWDIGPPPDDDGMLPQLSAPNLNFGRKVGYTYPSIPQDADSRYISVEHSFLQICLVT